MGMFLFSEFVSGSKMLISVDFFATINVTIIFGTCDCAASCKKRKLCDYQ